MLLYYLITMLGLLHTCFAQAVTNHLSIPHRQYDQYHHNMKRDVLIPSQLPGALASVPLPNNMEVSVLFTQYPGYVSYTITLNPNGIPLPAAGAVCLSWAIGLPGIYIDSTHQCNFPGSPSCLGGVPTNPCADRGTLNLTDTCNPIEYLSGKSYIHRQQIVYHVVKHHLYVSY
jgi:hypothetical protein